MLFATVPVITPVFTSKLRPGGNPVAVKVKTSPSMSVKLAEMSKLITLLSASAWSSMPSLVGASLTAEMVTLTLAVLSPPSPSLMV